MFDSTRFVTLSTLALTIASLVAGSDLNTAIGHGAIGTGLLLYVAVYSRGILREIREGRAYRARTRAETAEIYRQTALVEIQNTAVAAWAQPE